MGIPVIRENVGYVIKPYPKPALQYRAALFSPVDPLVRCRVSLSQQAVGQGNFFLASRPSMLSERM